MSFDETLRKLGISTNLSERQKGKDTIHIKGENRITVALGDQKYVVPTFMSRAGNLCWSLLGVLYAKSHNGIVKKEGNKWVAAEFITTQAEVSARSEMPESTGLSNKTVFV